MEVGDERAEWDVEDSAVLPGTENEESQVKRVNKRNIV
jgi:hypothetical protein